MTIESYENMLRILDVPREVFPNGAAKDYLIELAAAGEDCYCYAPLQLDTRPAHKRWDLWLMGQRFDLREWLQQFSHGTDEVY